MLSGRPPWMVEVLAMHGAIGSAKGWRAFLNQMSEDEQKELEKIHREEIAEVLIAVGKSRNYK